MKKAILLTLILAVSACSSTSKQKEEEEEKINQKEEIHNFIKNKRFHLIEINGEKIPYHYNSNIMFKNNEKDNVNFFTSKTPCNRVFGNFELKGNRLIITDKKSTKMFCVKEQKVKHEMLMQSIYNSELKVKLNQKGFVLSNENHTMKFKKYHK